MKSALALQILAGILALAAQEAGAYQRRPPPLVRSTNTGLLSANTSSGIPEWAPEPAQRRRPALGDIRPLLHHANQTRHNVTKAPAPVERPQPPRKPRRYDLPSRIRETRTDEERAKEREREKLAEIAAHKQVKAQLRKEIQEARRRRRDNEDFEQDIEEYRKHVERSERDLRQVQEARMHELYQREWAHEREREERLKQLEEQRRKNLIPAPEANYADLCAQMTTCDGCVADFRCGWCPTDASCIVVNEKGLPEFGTCDFWVFGGKVDPSVASQVHHECPALVQRPGGNGADGDGDGNGNGGEGSGGEAGSVMGGGQLGGRGRGGGDSGSGKDDSDEEDGDGDGDEGSASYGARDDLVPVECLGFPGTPGDCARAKLEGRLQSVIGARSVMEAMRVRNPLLEEAIAALRGNGAVGAELLGRLLGALSNVTEDGTLVLRALRALQGDRTLAQEMSAHVEGTREGRPYDVFAAVLDLLAATPGSAYRVVEVDQMGNTSALLARDLVSALGGDRPQRLVQEILVALGWRADLRDPRLLLDLTSALDGNRPAARSLLPSLLAARQGGHSDTLDALEQLLGRRLDAGRGTAGDTGNTQGEMLRRQEMAQKEEEREKQEAAELAQKSEEAQKEATARMIKQAACENGCKVPDFVNNTVGGQRTESPLAARRLKLKMLYMERRKCADVDCIMRKDREIDALATVAPSLLLELEEAEAEAGHGLVDRAAGRASGRGTVRGVLGGLVGEEDEAEAPAARPDAVQRALRRIDSARLRRRQP